MTSSSLISDLPRDWRSATLVGRLQFKEGPQSPYGSNSSVPSRTAIEGPIPVVVSGGRVRDVSRHAATVSDLLSQWQGGPPPGEDLGPLEELSITRAYESTPALRLLAPFDLQCIKACGVTFAISAVERVIEERARGNADQAHAIRQALSQRVGADIRSVQPGTDAAARLKAALIADGLWSQYLEVAIGPDAEVFTKSPLLSSMGWGDWIGIRPDSHWNNPEPEIVLACDRQGRTLGAALGNDVNLRDIEGRSALLLGKAKDNTGSCAIGPFIRMFDDTFNIDTVRSTVVSLEVLGEDNFQLYGDSSMSLISRDPLELVRQTLSYHDYPDGFALFLGTMFAPTQDRDNEGRGFTHKVGDVVRVSSQQLGTLVNKVTTCDRVPPWTFGVTDLMRNLASRKLLS